MMKPSIGRIVHYKLTVVQAEHANSRRVKNAARKDNWAEGAVAHVGNNAHPGDIVPLLICKVWPDEFGPGKDGVNGQAFLDGNDTLWITSAAQYDPEERLEAQPEGEPAPGTWIEPPRV